MKAGVYTPRGDFAPPTFRVNPNVRVRSGAGRALKGLGVGSGAVRAGKVRSARVGV